MSQSYTSDERCCYCYEGVDHNKAQHDEALWYLTPSGRKAMETFFRGVRRRRETADGIAPVGQVMINPSTEDMGNMLDAERRRGKKGY